MPARTREQAIERLAYDLGAIEALAGRLSPKVRAVWEARKAALLDNIERNDALIERLNAKRLQGEEIGP